MLEVGVCKFEIDYSYKHLLRLGVGCTTHTLIAMYTKLGREGVCVCVSDWQHNNNVMLLAERWTMFWSMWGDAVSMYY